MLWVSRILASLVKHYIASVSQAAGEYRLVIPGLTAQIGEELHSELLANGIHSFFVIAKNRTPDEAKRWLLPVSLTTMRIGSFVAVADPGALSDIRDSIRGSGGAIRGAALSEEWPWIDNGSEAFHFIGPFLSNLVSAWSSDRKTRSWLETLIADVLLECTRRDHDRTSLFLERILGTFNPATPIELRDVRERFLFHCGIPNPGEPDEAPHRLARDTRTLVSRIIDRVRTEPELRAQVIGNIDINSPDSSIIRTAVDAFFDGLASTSSLDGDVLALQNCWGSGDAKARNWQCLTSSRLQELFEVQELRPVELSCSFAPGTGVLISEDGKCAVGASNAELFVNAHFDIPADEFASGTCRLVLAIRRREVAVRDLSESSGDVQIPLNIEQIGVSYRSRVPVRVAVVIDNEVRGEGRLVLHCFGVQRPAFVVITPHFWVDDADIASEDDPAPERRHLADGPVRLHLFSFESSQPSVTRDDGSIEQLVCNNNTWETAESLDAFGEPAGQVTCRCQLGARWVSLTFEAEDIERGEFTLEDELRQILVSAKKDRAREILAIYTGHAVDPYSRLGGLNETTRRRIRLAKCFEDRVGWKPVLADLLIQTDGTEEACGDFARTIRGADASAIRTVKLPDDALEMLRQYTDRRDSFRQLVIGTLRVSGAKHEHPEYAIHPFYVAEESNQRQSLEQALSAYLVAHGRLQVYLHESQKRLDWSQLFVLTYLDCVVQWRDDASKNAFFLLGPWHPLVAAKRFLIQRALVLRAKRMVDGNDKEFHELIGLLSQYPGFHWYPSLKADDVALEPAYATPTSDPGWHLAFKRHVAAGDLAGSPGSLLEEIMRSIRDNIGLEARIHLPASGAMVGTVLSSYMRTFPSKRHVGVYFPVGFRGEDEVVTADRFLHTDDGPTQAGLQFTGGLSLLFGNTPDFPESIGWADPPLKVFRYEERNTCIAEQHPDIQFCQTGNKLGFLEMEEARTLPRGREYEAVFSQPVSRLTHGQTFIPKSIVEEWDLVTEGAVSLGDLFVRSCGLACALCGRPQGIVHTTSLPLRLETAWTVVPGAVLDPAVFVRYVRDGKDRQLEGRALWDYRVSLSRAYTSFFVLSTIPAAFRSAVNGVFGVPADLASEFVTELGQIGLAIAGEAMKSGRHALGSVGVVGAVRLFSGHADSSGPLRWSRTSVGFLLPVDSFRDVLEGGVASFGQHDESERHRRADLLAFVLHLPNTPDEKLIIQTASVECKFTSGTFSENNVQPALEQARATTEKVRRLCNAAQTPSGMPERLALLQLMRFGLRITGTHDQGDGPNRLQTERLIYECVLRGEFEYRAPRTSAVLVSTELSLPGAAEFTRTNTGLWIRLNQRNWPGVAETASIDPIRQAVTDLFDLPDEPRLASSSTGDKSPSGPESQVAVASPATSHITPAESSCNTGEDDTTGIEIDIAAAPSMQGVELSLESEVAATMGIVLRPILMGVDTSRRSVYFDPHSPVDRLDNANAMITGSSGKGKTQLLKYVITAIRDQGANTLVLDFKNDFASDSHFVDRAQLSSILVAFDGMPFNPLIPYPIKDPRSGERFIQSAQHIAGVASVLRRTYGLGPQQEAAVKNAIRQAFAEAGVNPASTVTYDPAMSFPDLARVGEILEQTNSAAYNRLDPLFTLGLFRETYSKSSFATMVNLSAAIDFSQIPSDALKNALAELVVLSAHSYFNSQPHSGTLRQVFVVDEAHRILTADYLERFALECRAYGVSLFLSSQYPSHFPAGISSSLATKIIHGNDRDVDRVRDIVNLLGCVGREAEIADLGMFEAIFSNKHFRNVMLRTITYPLYLVLDALQQHGQMNRNEIAQIEGVDTHKLSVGNIVRQLERLGLCESVEDKVRLVTREG
ncbi:MAG: type IV secretion system DNA-binding domain-containing protein [Terracidiphilus sp.]